MDRYENSGVFARDFPDECFWLESNKLVLLDFGPDPHTILPNDTGGKLWCPLPGRADARAILGALPRAEFIRLARELPYILQSHEIVALIAQHYRERWQAQVQAAERDYLDQIARRKAYYRIARQRYRRF